MTDQTDAPQERAPAFEFEASDGQRFEFAVEDDAIQYAQRERDKWEWLRHQPRLRDPNDPLNPVRTIFAALDAVLAASSQGQPKNLRDQEIQSRLDDYFKWVPAIHDRSALQPFHLRSEGAK